MTVRAYNISAELTSNDYSVTQDAKAEAAFAIEQLYDKYFNDPEKLYEFFNPEYEYQLSQWDFWNIAFILGAEKITGSKETARGNAIKALQRKGVDVSELRRKAEAYKQEQDELRLRQQ